MLGVHVGPDVVGSFVGLTVDGVVVGSFVGLAVGPAVHRVSFHTTIPILTELGTAAIELQVALVLAKHQESLNTSIPTSPPKMHSWLFHTTAPK